MSGVTNEESEAIMEDEEDNNAVEMESKVVNTIEIHFFVPMCEWVLIPCR